MSNEERNYEENSAPAKTIESSADIETYTKFDDMGLQDLLLRGIYAYGFEKPSAIQQKVNKKEEMEQAELFGLTFSPRRLLFLWLAAAMSSHRPSREPERLDASPLERSSRSTPRTALARL